MKLYLVVHQQKINYGLIDAWAEIEHDDDGKIIVKAVKAFTRKKYAKEWINNRGYNHFIIKSVDI